MCAGNSQLSKSLDRKQQELSILEKYSQLDRAKLQELENRMQEVKLSRSQKYAQLEKLDRSERVAKIDEIEKMEQLQLNKLDDEKSKCHARLGYYEDLKRDVLDNVPHSKRSRIKMILDLHDDMA